MVEDEGMISPSCALCTRAIEARLTCSLTMKPREKRSWSRARGEVGAEEDGPHDGFLHAALNDDFDRLRL